MRALRPWTMIALGSAGCTTFSSMPEPEPDAGEIIVLADGCEGALPAPLADGQYVVATEGLADSIGGLEACGAVTPLSFADGFFTLHANAGERLHVRAAPTDPAQDVALYYLAGCTPEACATVQDRCGAGLEEATTLLAPGAGDWIVGIESDLALELGVTVSRPRCGDAVLGPGETCDDGNLVDRDGCDTRCRAVLSADELEPNDDPVQANVIPPLATPIGSTLLAGSIGGCEADEFAIELVAGALIQVKILAANGMRCLEAPSAPIALELHRDGQFEPLGTGAPGRTAGECPSIELDDPIATIEENGSYRIVIRMPDGEFAYRLFVEVTSP